MKSFTRNTLVLFAALAAACSNPPSPTPDASDNDSSMSQPDASAMNDGSMSQPDATSQPDASEQPDDAMQPDASSQPDAMMMSDACVPPMGMAPNLMGPGLCNTLEFGQPAAMATMVPNAITFMGGTIPQGIYDAVSYQRTTGSTMSSYRATLVVGPENRYTEIRQLSTNVMSPGPITRRSGVLMPSGTTLARTVMCTDGDGGTDMMTGPYSVETRCDGVYLHYGTANLWFTYRRR